MKKHLAIFFIIIALLLYACFITKSEYFNHPYPNIEEYLASFFIFIYTSTLLIWKKNRRKKIILGGSGIVVLFIAINALNYFHEWHPIRLNSPFNSTQSFKVNYEPFEWPEANPTSHGYDDTILNEYYTKLNSLKFKHSLI